MRVGWRLLQWETGVYNARRTSTFFENNKMLKIIFSCPRTSFYRTIVTLVSEVFQFRAIIRKFWKSVALENNNSICRTEATNFNYTVTFVKLYVDEICRAQMLFCEGHGIKLCKIMPFESSQTYIVHYF